MSKPILDEKYLTELEQFLQELTKPLHIEIVEMHYKLCSDYLNNTLSGKGNSYILPKSTTFIIKSKYVVRAHLFTRIFDDSPHYSTARNLGILTFDTGLWEAMKDKQVGQMYEFIMEEGKETQRGEIHFRTKSAKEKHRLRPEELLRVMPAQKNKVKKKRGADRGTYSFPIENKMTGEKKFITKRRVY